MADKKLIIDRRDVRGEDGYKVFSIRIKEETVAALERLSKETNRSRNELIGMMLEFALNHYEIR